jgi:hypothetical protein
MNDEGIGADVAGREGKSATDHTRYPYLTCEIGVGNQISYHRRPILNQYDGLAIATAKTGSGGNLPGYYVFAGGSNPVGLYSTLEENQEETGYWNEYPDISYDFQAAIKETGELAPSYQQVKKFHYFLNEFGDRLAPMLPVIPKNQESKEKLQWALRVKDNSGFIFGMNYYRGVAKPLQKGVQFSITLPAETITFPSKPVDVPDSCIFIWPLNFDMDGILLKYATAQPLCKLDNRNGAEWYFIQNLGVTPEMCLDAAQIASVDAKNAKVSQTDKVFILSNIKPGYSESIKVKTKTGKEINIVVFSFDEANKTWLLKSENQKRLFVSDANMYLNGKELFLYSYNPKMKLVSFGSGNSYHFNDAILDGKDKGSCKEYAIEVPEKKLNLDVRKSEILDDVMWLKSAVPFVSSKNTLYHKIFSKEADLINTSAIKSATLYFYTDIPAKIRINRNWLNQDITSGELIQLDVTGYLQKGTNILLADFPFMQGDGAFAAKIVVEYFNSDQVEIVSDASWLTSEVYTLPATWSITKNAKSPEIVSAKPVNYNNLNIPKAQWSLNIPNGYMKGLNNVYLYVTYNGDIGRCRLGSRLVSDNFFNGTPWQIQLKQFGDQLEDRDLTFEVIPLKPGFKILFDKNPEVGAIGTTSMSIKAIPEYSARINIDISH